MAVEDIIKKYRDIAVVGISDKPDRYSYQVAKFLMDRGYNIIPVNVAGNYFSNTEIEKYDPHSFEDALLNNARTFYNITKASVPVMKKQGFSGSGFNR